MIHKELWFTDKNKCEILIKEFSEMTSPIIVKSYYSLISNGTEKLVLSGNVPIELQSEMRVNYQKGDFNFPISYGYSVIGEVVKGPQNILGKMVHVMHPHHEYCAIQDQNDLYFLPENIHYQTASLASNIETALTAYWDAQLDEGDLVLIVGYGLIGQLLAEIIKNFGFKVIIFDINQQELIIKNGFDLFNPDNSTSNFNCAFNCSANEKGLQIGIDSVGFEGKIIEMSWYGNQSVNINLGGSFHAKRKKIIASQVSHIPGFMSDEWTFLKRKQLVFKLISQGIFNHILINKVQLEDAPNYYQKLLNNYCPTTIIQYACTQ